MKDFADVGVLWTGLCAVLLYSMSNIAGVSGQGSNHYCSADPAAPEETITGETEGSIYTLYSGESHYRNNQNCQWTIDAGPNNRVEFTVISSSLQWAPASAICPGYDHVAIKDGEEGGVESIVLQWCGHTKPLGAISSGRYVRVEFMSDKNNPYQYEGVHLRFRIFASSDCAPSWSVSPSNFCYKLLDEETDWSSAQRGCNSEHANLASVTSDTDHDFLLQTFGSRRQNAWIGLSDIVDRGVYKWIDGSEFTVDKFGSNHAVSQYFRCVALRFREGIWQVQDCKGYQAKPLCKSNRGERTPIYPIPQRKPEEDDYNMPSGVLAAIIVSVIVLVILIIVGCIICRRKKHPRKSAYKHTDTESPDQQTEAVNLQGNPAGNRTNQQPSAPPVDTVDQPIMNTPMSQMVAPPAYEDAIRDPVLKS